MLKAEIKPNGDKTSISIEICGDLRRVCADVSAMICAIDERLTKNDPRLGHEFKVLFTKGFMDGVCFGVDREHMEHYLAEGDKNYHIRKNDFDSDPFMKLLNDLCEFLKDKNAKLEKIEEDGDNDETE